MKHETRRGMDGRIGAGYVAAHRIIAAVFAGLLAAATPSPAENYTWDGGGTDNNFSTADNWNAAPVAGTSNFLIFDGTTRLTPNNDLTAGTAFGGLSFALNAGNFTLSGNTLRLGDANNTTLTIGSDAAGAIVVNNNIELDEAQVRFNSSSGGSLTVNGLIGMPSSRTSFSELLVTRGTVYFTNSGNDFNAGMGIIGGKLVVANIANSGVASAIGIGSFIRLGNAGGAGTFEYTGAAASTDRQLRIGGGDLSTHTGGGVITSSGTGAMTFTAAAFIDPIATATATRTLTLRGTYTGADNVIQGVIADNHTANGGIINLVKNDAGTWRLEGLNTYSGTTTVSAGTLVAANANALGSTTAGTTVASGATLGLQGNITTAAEALSITGAGVGSGGALRNLSGNNTYSGIVTLAGAASIGSDAGDLTVSGQITGSQTLTVVGSGTVTLSNTGNDFTGLVVDGGTLHSGDSGVIGDAVEVQVKSGTWNLNGFDETVGYRLWLGGVAGSALIDTADWTGSGTLTLTGETTRIDYLNTGDPAGAVINGNLDYIGSGANHFLLAAANSPNATEELTINAVIGNGNAGTGIWYTGGDGVIVLNGANTFNASSLQIRSATVVLGHNDYRDGTTAGALGKNTQIVSVGHTSGTSDAALLLKAGVTTDRLVRTVDDTGGAANTRTLGGYDTTGSATFAHTIELRNPTVGGGMTRLQALGISTITFAGVINQDGENTVGIEKIGSGTVVLSGNNSYKGETVVSAGTLVIDGIYTSPGLITVKGGATLGGIGIVGAINVESTGTLAPGNSIGEMEGTSLTLDGGSILAWELHDNGADSDLLTLSGGLNQGSDTGWTFDFLGTGAVGTYTLIKFASTDFVTGDFGITGLKDGYSAPDGVVVNTSLSEVQLTVIPEPASLGALGMIALAALLRRRLRR